MVKIVDKQTAFNTGIITSKLRGRDDIKQYSTGVSDALNFIASKYGPIIKRTGTTYKGTLSYTGSIKLIPFVFSVRQSVILELREYQKDVSHKYIRIYFYTFSGEDFGAVASASDPTQPYYLDTDIPASEIDKISYATSLDVIYMAFPSGTTRPKELRRYANNNWELVDYTFEDGPYKDQNYDSTQTVQVSSTTTGTATLTVSGFTLSASDVGRHIRINHPDETTLDDRWGWGIIQAVNSATSATVLMKQKAWATTATSDFRLGAWGEEQGWPTLVSIHEQRLVWSGTTDYPWLWMSNSFNYHNFSPSDYSGTIKDSSAIYYNMATDKVAPVRWLASLGSLIIGTEMYEMRMYSAGAGLAPGDCVVRKESTYGAHSALPIITDDTLIFIQRLQRRVRAIAYDYTRDAYVGPELSVLAESLMVQGLVKIVHQREPNDIVWGLLEDGTLLAHTYDKEQEVTAWTRVEIAGTDTKVLDMVTIPSDTWKQDVLVLWLERKIKGKTVRTVEVLGKEYLENIELADVTYLDASMRYQGAPTTIISGLSHLTGETVRVMNRGGIHEDVVVSDKGVIEFQRPLKDGWIGLPYEAYFETLERDFGDKQISIKMSRARVHRLVLYILRTLGLEVYQQTRGIYTQLITFSPKSNMDTPPEPVSGEKEHDVMTAWTSPDMYYSLRFISEPGLPCTIAGIYAGVEINAL